MAIPGELRWKRALGPLLLMAGAVVAGAPSAQAAPKGDPIYSYRNQATHRCLLDGPDIVYVDRRRSGRAANFAMGLHLHVGSRLPAYCTSMGKVLLAHQDPAELRALLDRTDLARRGPKTITAREQLMTALNRVRHNGIAVNDEELAAGLRSVAAPVRDRSGRVVAAVNIAIHLTVWNASVESVVRRLEGPLRHTVEEISARLGYRP